MEIGEVYNIEATAVPSNATISGRYTYTSSDATIATVNQTKGIVTACRPGKAVINIAYYDSNNDILINKSMNVHIVLPIGSGSLKYEPERWNESEDVGFWNCYAYAFDLYDSSIEGVITESNDYFFEMGGISDALYESGVATNGDSMTTILEYVKDDISVFYPNLDREELLIEVGLNDEVPENRYKVVLFVGFRPNYNAFHWYRQNSDGTWSHKEGGSEVTNLDSNNEIIYNPVTCAKSDTYYEYVGCYAVQPWY